MGAFKELLVTSALLHDIGKVIFRTRSTGTRYSHEELGAFWADQVGFPKEITESIRYHHGDIPTELPRTIQNIISLIRSADRLAAGMERVDTREGEGRFDPDAVLENIFGSIDIGLGLPAETTFFPPIPGAFPQSKTSAGAIALVWNDLRDKLTPDLPIESLLLLLKNYLVNVPEYTWVGSAMPSTSLYHHVKSTAAIALADYLYLQDELGPDSSRTLFRERVAVRNSREERFMLIAADISGVQSFIYNISSKRALRLLRARSFTLELLCETVCSMIVEELGLERCSVIYSSGGGFSVLAPNTQKAIRTVKDISVRINSWLYEQFGTLLYVAFAWTAVTPEDLRKDLGPAWMRVHEELGVSKSRKWFEQLNDVFEPEPPKTYACESCGNLTDEIIHRDEIEVCPFCSKMIDIGRKLPEAAVIGRPVDPVDATECDLSIADICYSFTGPFVKQYILKPNHSADIGTPTWHLYSGASVTESEFAALADSSLGANRLGVLRMDVDRLGRIFSRGLEHRTLARMSDLSERLDYFFKVVLPNNPEGLLKHGLFSNVERNPSLAVVYSGGDDLFLVGAWDQVIDVAFAINKLFTEYVGGNPNVTLSAGIVIADYRLALQKLATLAGEEEKRAKTQGRNRFSLGEISFLWQDKDLLQKVLNAVVDIRKSWPSLKISKNLLHQLQVLFASRDNEETAWRLPRLYYTARRAEAPEIVVDIVPLVERDDLVRCALGLADLACRGGVEG